MDACFGNVYLMFAYCRDCSKYLAVDVRQAHTVVVDDVDGADATAGEHFNDIATYSTDTEDSHT